jgi:hypothetical protein
LNPSENSKNIQRIREFANEIKILSMDISEMELRGVKLPDRETCLGELSAQQIVEKINAFHERLKKESRLDVAQFAESYFLNLIALYPVSMCSRSLSEELKLVVSLFFFGSKPAKEENSKAKADAGECKELFPNITPSHVHDGYSYDDLALIFDRNKSAICEAIKQKQEIAKIMLEETMLRCESKKIALERLAEEEQGRLIQNKPDK